MPISVKVFKYLFSPRRYGLPIAALRKPARSTPREPADFAALRLGAHARKVSPRAGFTRANTEERLAPATRRNVALLRFTAEI